MEQNLVKPGPKAPHSANWKPGQSGNLNGRPVGVRNQFTMAFVQDLRDVWQEVGKETMVKTAKNQPEAFFATCARILPKDVAISIEQQFPGKPLEPTMGKDVGQGSLTGKWEPRPGARPNIRGHARTGSAGENQALADGLDQEDRRRPVRVAAGRDRRQRREAEPVIRSPAPAAERVRRGRPVYG